MPPKASSEAEDADLSPRGGSRVDRMLAHGSICTIETVTNRSMQHPSASECSSNGLLASRRVRT